MNFNHQAALFSGRHTTLLRTGAIVLVFLSLVTGLVLVTRHTHLSGPGDQLFYYAQAANLIPFTHNYYGPGYFLALRVVHDLLGIEWFTAGKIVSWLSTCAFLYLCHILFRRLLGQPLNWLALSLVATNPTLISSSYSSLTYAYGAVWIVGAIALTVIAAGRSSAMWLLSGMVFGMAFLTRFQALGFLLGAVAGLLLSRDSTTAGRLRNLAALIAGVAMPVASWYLLLEWKQGFIPANHNFIHLTIALGKFKSFHETQELISEYGSMLGVLRAEGAVSGIGQMAIKEILRFPFTVGFDLVFLAAGWLIPGLLVTMLRRTSCAPWFFAFVSGLFLTGLGSRGWLGYYLAILPFTVILISNGARALAAGGKPVLVIVQGSVLIASTVLWSPIIVWRNFLVEDWPEWSAARAYLQTHAGPADLVSSTAASLPYGTTLRFVDRDEFIKPGQDGELLERLRARGVTYLVLTERHGFEEFPGLQYLLADTLPILPKGFDREMLVRTPSRLAIYRVSRQ